MVGGESNNAMFSAGELEELKLQNQVVYKLLMALWADEKSTGGVYSGLIIGDLIGGTEVGSWEYPDVSTE